MSTASGHPYNAAVPAPPRILAVISDVHGNMTALRAVLADADAHGAEEIVAAGDVIGFGPESSAAVDLLRERGARMIRGNHEKDHIATFLALGEAAGDRRLGTLFWTMARLGPERRAYLSALPDELLIDAATLVVHGSPRHVRDAVLPWRSDAELSAMYAGHPSRLAFMGHTHRPHVRDLPERRLVNVGSVGMPLDGDPRACYFLIRGGREPGAWQLEERRVAYDLAAQEAALRHAFADLDPGYFAIMRRQLHDARDYFGPWLRRARDVPDDALDDALADYLAGIS
jgi:predicted phosphodiesterase